MNTGDQNAVSLTVWVNDERRAVTVRTDQPLLIFVRIRSESDETLRLGDDTAPWGELVELSLATASGPDDIEVHRLSSVPETDTIGLDPPVAAFVEFGVDPEAVAQIGPADITVSATLQDVDGTVVACSNDVDVTIVESDPSIHDPSGILATARYYLARDRLADASDQVDAVLDITPMSIPALIVQGEIAAHRGHHEQALVSYHRALEAYREDPEPRTEPPDYLLSLVQQSLAALPDDGPPDESAFDLDSLFETLGGLDVADPTPAADDETRDETPTDAEDENGPLDIPRDDPRFPPPDEPIVTLETTFTESYDEDILPLIFVPGFMGSTLWWMPFEDNSVVLPAFPSGQDPHLSRQLLADEDALTAGGLMPGVYTELIDFITRDRDQGGLGHTEGKDFWIFTYDWRRSNDISGTALHDFAVQKLTEANANRQRLGLPLWEAVDIINHSMGGFVTRAARLAGPAPFDRVAYIASPHWGAPKAHLVLHLDTRTGMINEFFEGLVPAPVWWALRKGIGPVVSWLLEDWHSVYELLPDRNYDVVEYPIVIDETGSSPAPVQTIDESYFEDQWQLHERLHDKANAGLAFKQRLGGTLNTDDNLAIYSSQYPTYACGSYDATLVAKKRDNFGDGTVPEHSANQDQRARRVAVPGEHTELQNLPQTHHVLRDFLLYP